MAVILISWKIKSNNGNHANGDTGLNICMNGSKAYCAFLLIPISKPKGIPTIKAKENPLPWLDWVLNGVSHDNFFEKRVTEYSVNGMDGDWGWKERAA